jgi:hypothetical protein
MDVQVSKMNVQCLTTLISVTEKSPSYMLVAPSMLHGPPPTSPYKNVSKLFIIEKYEMRHTHTLFVKNH